MFIIQFFLIILLLEKIELYYILNGTLYKDYIELARYTMTNTILKKPKVRKVNYVPNKFVDCCLCQRRTSTPLVRLIKRINGDNVVDYIHLCNKHGLFVTRRATILHIEQNDVLAALLLLNLSKNV